MMEQWNIRGVKLANIGMLWIQSDRHLPHMVLWALPRMAEKTETRFAMCKIKYCTRDV
jgi:hypothetical protein